MNYFWRKEKDNLCKFQLRVRWTRSFRWNFKNKWTLIDQLDHILPSLDNFHLEDNKSVAKLMPIPAAYDAFYLIWFILNKFILLAALDHKSINRMMFNKFEKSLFWPNLWPQFKSVNFSHPMERMHLGQKFNFHQH